MSSSLIAAAKYVGEKFLSTLTQTAVDRCLRLAARVPIPGITWLHFIELRGKIKQMPFIYKGLDSDVLTDFVDIDLTALDPALSRKPLQRFEMSSQERFRNRKRIILFGRGGIGKTTYLRRTVLDILDSKGYSKRFNKDEFLIPFYVPLKAIDNTDELPILKHLLANNSFLSGARGLRRLISAAKRGRLIFFLDGYDEIPFPTGTTKTSFVVEEIELLLGVRKSARSIFPSLDHASFYENAAYCRVWITSRLEFFSLNPFDLSPGALALEITGVPAQNRALLVRHIFERYRATLERHGIEVSHEDFIRHIERSARDELISLSFNPLFLTVMAYIYVNRVIDKGTHDVALAHNVVELIHECVDLLLIDLDDARARGLSYAHRDALVSRRNEWIDEKRRFLGYLALELLLEARPTFGAAYITEKTTAFFKGNEGEPEADKILHSISKSSSLPGFVDQLIYCGLFVQVDRSEHETLYDFPHRKFREVLAAKYLSTRSDHRLILNKLMAQPQLESLAGIFEATPFQDAIVSLLCERAMHSPERVYGLALNNCLEQSPPGYDPTETLWNFFFQCLRERGQFSMPRGVLSHVRAQPEVLLKIGSTLERAIEDGDSQRIALSSELIRECFGVGALCGILEPQMRNASNRQVFAVLAYEYIQATGTLPQGLIASLRDDRRAIVDAGVVVARCARTRVTPAHLAMFRSLIDLADEVALPRLLREINHVSAGIIPILCDKDVFATGRLETIAWLCHKWEDFSSEQQPRLVVTLGAIEEACGLATTLKEAGRLRNLVWRYRGSVYYDDAYFLRSASSGDETGKDGNEAHVIPHLSPEMRALLLEKSRVEDGLYTTLKDALLAIVYVRPEFPSYFE